MSLEKKGNTIITYFFSLLVILFSVGLLIILIWTDFAFNVINTQIIDSIEVVIAIGIVAVILIILALRTLWVGVNVPKSGEKHALVRSGEKGEVFMSFEAISNCILKASYQIRGVKEVKPKIKTSQEGILIQLNVSVLPETNIPQITNDLQEKITQHLQDFAGIRTAEVKVVIEDVKSQEKVSRAN